MFNSYFYKLILVFLSVLLVFFCLIPVVDFDLVWDDYLFLYDTDKYIGDEKWLDSAFSAFFVSDNYFRPLPIASYKLDYYLFGDLSGFHLMQLVYYILVFLVIGFCIYYFLKRTYSSVNDLVLFLVAIFGSLFLALHSSNIESAAWVSCRFEVLFALFSIITYLLSISEIRLFFKIPAIFFSFLLAALSKEMAVIVPVLIFMLHWFFIYRQNGEGFFYSVLEAVRKNYLSYLAIVLSGFSYLAIRYLSLGYLLVEDVSFSQDYGDTYQRFLAVSMSYAYYFGLLFLPFFTVQPVYDISFPIVADDRSIYIFVFVLFLFFLSVLGTVRYKSVLAFFVLAFMCSLLPVVHFLPMLKSVNIVQSRFALLPSVFWLVFILVIFLNTIFSEYFTKYFKIFILFSVLLYSTSIIIDGRKVMYMWSDNLSLWSWSLGKVSEDNMSTMVNYAAALQQFRKPTEAISFLERSKEKGIQWSLQAYSVYANALLTVGRFEDAKSSYLSVISLTLREISKVSQSDTDRSSMKYLEMLLSQYYISLAHVLFISREGDDYSDIEDLLITAENINPWGYQYNALLAFVYLKSGKLDEAERRASIYKKSAPEQKALSFEREYEFLKMEVTNSP